LISADELCRMAGQFRTL